MPLITFYIFSFILILSAVIVVSARNPVYSVLFLILAFFNCGALFVIIGAEFIAMLLVIVYVGAVAVLFLFVVMMLNINFEEVKSRLVSYLPVGIFIAILICVQLIMVITSDKNPVIIQNMAVVTADNTKTIGMLLYTEYFYPFQMAGLILFVAMIGAIILTNVKSGKGKRQSINKQVNRDSRDIVKMVSVENNKGLN